MIELIPTSSDRFNRICSNSDGSYSTKFGQIRTEIDGIRSNWDSKFGQAMKVGHPIRTNPTDIDGIRPHSGTLFGHARNLDTQFGIDGIRRNSPLSEQRVLGLRPRRS